MNQADRESIEREARLALYEVWKDRDVIWPMTQPTPLQMFDPVIVAKHLGYEVEFRQHIPAMPGTNVLAEAAGTVDGRRGVICVSRKYSYEIQRFTVAHELGHLLLGHAIHAGPLHRDRPILAYDTERPRMEAEADYFAASLLVPRRMLFSEFRDRFGSLQPLPLTETVAYHLGTTPYSLAKEPRRLRAFAATVAAATKFDRKRFSSLHKVFGVSVPAMAIRLEEIGLVAE